LSAGVHLEAGVCLNPSNLFADRRAIRQILLNLLSNAIKFSPNGLVTVLLDRAVGGGIALIVRDTGIGMTPEEIEIALSPFGQVANEHTRLHDGSGLGLPLVKSMAALHGAEFSIDSRPGEGTSVSILFPAVRVLHVREPAAA